MLQTLHKEIKNDGDWVVYEDLEDFKEQFCSWVDASIGEGLSDDSKVLSLKKDGRMYLQEQLHLVHFQDLLILYRYAE